MMRIICLLLLMLIHSALSAAEFKGVLGWGERVELGLAVSGVIQQIHVSTGQRVKQGDLLLNLDERYLDARLATADSALTEAGLARDEAERELDRANELYDRTVLSDHDLQMAQLGAARAEAAWQRARSQLLEARVMLTRHRVHAPFSGVIVDIPAQVGEAVVSETRRRPLLVMASDEQMLAISRATADRLPQRGVGARVLIGGNEIGGRVRHVGLEPVDKTGETPLYTLSVEFTRPDWMNQPIGTPLTIITED